MTLVKVCPKFECNLYSDIDLQSAISVSSTRNRQSFTVLTDRLAFVNFSSPGWMIMKSYVKWNLVYSWKDLLLRGVGGSNP